MGGDRLLVLVFLTDTVGFAEPGAPSGWTRLLSSNWFSNGRLQLHAKVADGTEGGGTITLGSSGSAISAAQCYRISDWYGARSEEHTSELQSLMRISYAVFCLKKKKKTTIDI